MKSLPSVAWFTWNKKKINVKKTMSYLSSYNDNHNNNNYNNNNNNKFNNDNNNDNNNNNNDNNLYFTMVTQSNTGLCKHS